MSKTKDLFENIETLYTDFRENHQSYSNNGTKLPQQGLEKPLVRSKNLLLITEKLLLRKPSRF